MLGTLLTLVIGGLLVSFVLSKLRKGRLQGKALRADLRPRTEFTARYPRAGRSRKDMFR